MGNSLLDRVHEAEKETAVWVGVQAAVFFDWDSDRATDFSVSVEKGFGQVENLLVDNVMPMFGVPKVDKAEGTENVSKKAEDKAEGTEMKDKIIVGTRKVERQIVDAMSDRAEDAKENKENKDPDELKKLADVVRDMKLADVVGYILHSGMDQVADRAQDAKENKENKEKAADRAQDAKEAKPDRPGKPGEGGGGDEGEVVIDLVHKYEDKILGLGKEMVKDSAQDLVKKGLEAIGIDKEDKVNKKPERPKNPEE